MSKSSQKSNFQPSTTKLDNIGHPIVETRQIWPLGGFVFLKKYIIRSKKSKLIHFKSEKYEANLSIITLFGP